MKDLSLTEVGVYEINFFFFFYLTVKDNIRQKIHQLSSQNKTKALFLHFI